VCGGPNHEEKKETAYKIKKVQCKNRGDDEEKKKIQIKHYKKERTKEKKKNGTGGAKK